MDFACADCGTTEATTYVVTGAVDDKEGRTEVCLACYELDSDTHGTCVSFEQRDEEIEETEKTTRENIIYELKSSLDSLVRAVEFDRPDDIVGSTDLLLHGLPVAIARAAYEIALEAAGEVEAWRR